MQNRQTREKYINRITKMIITQNSPNFNLNFPLVLHFLILTENIESIS